MPYVTQEDRDKVFEQLKPLLGKLMSDPRPGLLNYIYTMLADTYTQSKGLSYGTLNDVVGVFASAQSEYQRRVVAKYEDQKILENGDVYGILADRIDPGKIVDPPDIFCEETQQHWMPCKHPDCDLHLTGPGRIDCSGFCLDEDEDFNNA